MPHLQRHLLGFLDARAERQLHGLALPYGQRHDPSRPQHYQPVRTEHLPAVHPLFIDYVRLCYTRFFRGRSG